MRATKCFKPLVHAARKAGAACLAAAALACLPLHSSAQGTFEPLTVTFDGPPVLRPGASITVQQYLEGGMWFAGIPGTDGFGRTWSGDPRDPYNGSVAFLQAALGDSLMFGLDDGSSFEPVSVDLAEYSTVVPDAVTVSFVGCRSDGGTVTVSFTTDGIMDGTGPLTDFQTFYFGPEFAGVYQVRIPAYGWSLDNLVVSRWVPEPGTGALLCVGAVLLGIRLFKRRSRM
jgi:hypothetical protein